jgi:hypothetical protein
VDRSDVKGRLFALLTAGALLTGCSDGAPSQPSNPAAMRGTRIASGEARALAASADGAFVAWLDDCHVARGQYLPPGTANCSLRVAPSAGGEAKRVGGAVTSLPQGIAWSPVGATLVALADYDYAAGSGTLLLWRDGAPRELARDVTFYGFGRGGELGYVSGGRLSVLLPGEAAPRLVPGADGVASFELSPEGAALCAKDPTATTRLLARRSRAAGGQLLFDDCRLGKARALLERAGDYALAPDGELFAATVEEKGGAALRVGRARGAAESQAVGRQVSRFAFSPVGRALAFLGDVTPGREGNLYLVAPGSPAVRAAKEVGDFRWAAKAPRLAWLERYDPRVRSGVVGAGGPGLVPRTYGKNVTDFDLSADGRYVAFLQHTARGGYSVDLGLADLEAKAGVAPATIAQGVFGFSFAPDAKWLYYRTRCVRNGEGCDLERVPAAGLAKDGKPEPIAQGMKSFEFDPRDPSRLLIGWQRMDRAALDVAVWQGGRLHKVAETVLPGSARFLGPDSRRVGVVVSDPARAGVYVVDVAP